MLKTNLKLDFIFVVIGVVAGFASFLVINAFLLGDLTFSIVSGTTLTIGGLRIHHYLIGLSISIAGLIIKRKLGSFLVGFGAALMFDDLGELV